MSRPARQRAALIATYPIIPFCFMALRPVTGKLPYLAISNTMAILIIYIRTEWILGAEALVRWKRQDGSIMPPSEFLPVFEKDGLIGQLDAYVFEQTCAFQRRWMDRGLPLLPVSVNLSRNSIYRTDIVKRYLAVTKKYGIPASCVPIEITESAFVDSGEVKPIADEFLRAGFQLHMDDFGSGRSSLSTLNILKFSVAKIDKSLVDYIGDPRGNKVLCHTMALMGDLGLKIVTEGVETQEQKQFLIENGVDAIQGYYYTKPMPEEEYIRTVTENMKKYGRI